MSNILANENCPDTLRNAIQNGGPVVWASCLVMGLANILAGQYVLGLICLAIEIGVIVYMFIPMGGLYWLSMLPSLGQKMICKLLYSIDLQKARF